MPKKILRQKKKMRVDSLIAQELQDVDKMESSTPLQLLVVQKTIPLYLVKFFSYASQYLSHFLDFSAWTNLDLLDKMEHGFVAHSNFSRCLIAFQCSLYSSI